MNNLGLKLSKNIKTSGARLYCVEAEASERSVHEFAGVSVLSAERLGILHHRLFFYVPHVATSPKQVYFSHDLPYLYAVGFLTPNCFFFITIATDIVAYW